MVMSINDNVCTDDDIDDVLRELFLSFVCFFSLFLGVYVFLADFFLFNFLLFFLFNLSRASSFSLCSMSMISRRVDSLLLYIYRKYWNRQAHTGVKGCRRMDGWYKEYNDSTTPCMSSFRFVRGQASYGHRWRHRLQTVDGGIAYRQDGLSHRLQTGYHRIWG